MNVNTNRYGRNYTSLRGRLDTLKINIGNLQSGNLEQLKQIAIEVSTLQKEVSSVQSMFFKELGRLVAGRSLPFAKNATNRNTINFQVKQLMSMRRFWGSPIAPKISKMKEILDGIKALVGEANETKRADNKRAENARLANEERKSAAKSAANFARQKSTLNDAVRKLDNAIGARPTNNSLIQ
jgi:type III secretory pathway component EscV